MKKKILEVKGLKKYFPIVSGILRHQTGNIKAVDGIDFTLNEKEVLGIVGESGCGKSTVGRTAIRLLEPTEGSIDFMGQNLLAMKGDQLIEARKKLQMVFQDPYGSLNPRKTIGNSIGESLIYHGIITNTRECEEKVAEILIKIGLKPDVMNRYPHQFSGGQQQRICIGRAIAMNPALIVCDEAVSALDVSVQAQIMNLLSELKDDFGLSYLFISHSLSVIRHISDRIIVLYLGKVMEEGSTEAIFSNPKHPYTQSLLSAAPKQHPGETTQKIILKGEIPSPANPPSGCPFRTRCPYAKEECSLTPPKKTVYDPYTKENDHHYHCVL